MPDFPYPRGRDWVNKSEGWVEGDPVADAAWFEALEEFLHATGDELDAKAQVSGTPADGQHFRWDAASGTLVPVDAPPRILGDPADGQFFAWSEADSALVPVDAPSGGGGAAPVVLITIDGGANDISWPSQPSSELEFLSSNRHRFHADLTGVADMRINAMMRAAGNGAATLRVQWSADLSTWNTLAASGGEVYVPIGATGLMLGDWTPIAAAAKAPVYLRIVGAGGNDSTTPSFGNVQIQAR